MLRTIRKLSIALLILCPMLAENPAGNTAVAEIDGQTITKRDLQQAGGIPLSRLEDQLFTLQRQKLDDLIADRLLAREAQRRNLSMESLVNLEIVAKAGEVSAVEVHKVYELNKAQLQKPEAEVRDAVETYLRTQKVTARRQEFVNSLRSQAKLVTHLEPPAPFRAELSESGPVRGAASAPVTIVEFEDFQCPFCKRVHDTLDQVLKHYPDKVRLVHRDFPLQSLHPTSWISHEAARCAGDQGKFWEYRDLMYANTPSSGGQEQLKDFASQLKLDAPGFQSCLETKKFKAAIQKDEEEGVRLGLEGTPAFFINGRFLSGAQPESEFVRLIDQELGTLAKR